MHNMSALHKLSVLAQLASMQHSTHKMERLTVTTPVLHSHQVMTRQALNNINMLLSIML